MRTHHKSQGLVQKRQWTQLLGVVHQVSQAEYTRENGLTGVLLPAMIPVRSALSSSPKARVSGEKIIFYKFGGGGCGARSRKYPKARRIISALPYQLGLTLRCQRTRCASKTSGNAKVLVEADGVEPSGVSFADPAREPAAPIGA